MSPLPDDAWLERANTHLAGDAAWKKAVEQIGDPLYIKVKDEEGTMSVILQLGDGQAAPPVSRLGTDTVEGEGIIVSIGVETWERLLRGSTDLMTAFMSREIKAKASMFQLMKITDPAETLIQRMGAVQREA